jgi:hypothetical protein
MKAQMKKTWWNEPRYYYSILEHLVVSFPCLSFVLFWGNVTEYGTFSVLPFMVWIFPCIYFVIMMVPPLL